MSDIATLSVDLIAHDKVSAVLSKVEAGLDKTSATAGRAGRAVGDGFGAGAQKAASGALSLQSAQARLEAQQGNLAGAANRLRNALAQQTTTTTQTINAQRQLLAVETALAGGTSTLGGYFKNLEGSISAVGSGIGGVPGQLASVTTGIGALTVAAGVGVTVLKSFGDAFVFKTQLDATTKSIEAQLQGVRDTGTVFAEAESFANRYKLTQAETNDILQSSIGVLRTSTASVTELETVLLRLQSRDPSKPISEAARALRELNAGDVTTIKEIFNIGAADALRMKNEIQGGADAVQVLSTFLDGAGNGMEVLENRTVGAVGAMNDLAVAQENVTKAQAEIATSAGGVTAVQLYAQAWQGLANLLNGDVTSGIKGLAINQAAAAAQTQAHAMALAAGRTEAEAAALAQQVFNDVILQASQAEGLVAEATGIHTKAVVEHISAEQAAIQAIAAHTTETQANAEAAVLAAAKQEAQKVATEALTQETNAAVNAFLALNPNIDAAGIAALVAAGKIPALVGQLATLRLEAYDTAQAMATLAAQQAGVQGVSKLFADGVVAAVSFENAVGSALGALGGGAPRTLSGEIKFPKPPKIPKGGGGGGTRLSDQAKLNNQLLTAQEAYAQKAEQAEQAHLDKVLQINRDFAEKLKKAQDDFAQSQLDGRAGFYDTLGSIEDAGLRQSLAQQYEAAFQEADAIAREKGADVGQKFLEARQAAIQAQGQRASEIAAATKEGDKDKAEYLAGVDKLYRDAEARKLEAIKAGEGSIQGEQAAALTEEGARYAEAQAKIGESADQAAQRKILAAERAGKAIDAEALKVDGLAAKYDSLALAGSRAGVTAAPTGTGVPTSASAAAPAAPADVVAAVQAGVSQIVAALGSVVSAERDTTGAVRSLSGKFAS